MGLKYFYYPVIFEGVCCLHIQGGRVKLPGNLVATSRVVPLPLNPYPRPTRTAYFSNLKTEEKYSSETLIAIKQTARYSNTEVPTRCTSQSLFYLTTALHVSGIIVTHLQEHKKL
jgi:hypothetical protein